MFCRLEAVPAAAPCVSVIVVADRNLAALRGTLRSIARQVVMPLDVTIATRARDAEESRAMARVILPSGLPSTVVSDGGFGDVWALVPALLDGGAGVAIAIVADGDVLAPDFLEVAVARFGAVDGGSIAAVAVRAASDVATAECELDEGELQVADVLRHPEAPAACFVYRREAVERVGGWSPGLSAVAGRWDLHMRLVVEWRIALLPAQLAVSAAANPARDRAAVASFRSMQLRRLLRQSPEHLGLLLSLAQEDAANRQRAAELHARIDRLSRQLDDFALMLARQPVWRDPAPSRTSEGRRARRPGYDLPFTAARDGGAPETASVVEGDAKKRPEVVDARRATDAGSGHGLG